MVKMSRCRVCGKRILKTRGRVLQKIKGVTTLCACFPVLRKALEPSQHGPQEAVKTPDASGKSRRNALKILDVSGKSQDCLPGEREKFENSIVDPVNPLSMPEIDTFVNEIFNNTIGNSIGEQAHNNPLSIPNINTFLNDVSDNAANFEREEVTSEDRVLCEVAELIENIIPIDEKAHILSLMQKAVHRPSFISGVIAVMKSSCSGIPIERILEAED